MGSIDWGPCGRSHTPFQRPHGAALRWSESSSAAARHEGERARERAGISALPMLGLRVFARNRVVVCSPHVSFFDTQTHTETSNPFKQTRMRLPMGMRPGVILVLMLAAASATQEGGAAAAATLAFVHHDEEGAARLASSGSGSSGQEGASRPKLGLYAGCREGVGVSGSIDRSINLRTDEGFYLCWEHASSSSRLM